MRRLVTVTQHIRKFPKYTDNQTLCCNHSRIWTMWLYHRVMSPNDADWMANSVDPDQTAPLIWFCTVCPGISVRKLRIVMIVLLKMRHVMRVLFFSSFVNSFFKRACAAIQCDYMSHFLVGPFAYFHTSCLRTEKDLARLRGCAGSPVPSLIAYVINTIISWAGLNVFPIQVFLLFG